MPSVYEPYAEQSRAFVEGLGTDSRGASHG
jgi:hypothetical protein